MSNIASKNSHRLRSIQDQSPVDPWEWHSALAELEQEISSLVDDAYLQPTRNESADFWGMVEFCDQEFRDLWIGIAAKQLALAPDEVLRRMGCSLARRWRDPIETCAVLKDWRGRTDESISLEMIDEAVSYAFFRVHVEAIAAGKSFPSESRIRELSGRLYDN